MELCTADSIFPASEHFPARSKTLTSEMGTKHHSSSSSDPIDDPKKRRRVGFAKTGEYSFTSESLFLGSFPLLQSSAAFSSFSHHSRRLCLMFFFYADTGIEANECITIYLGLNFTLLQGKISQLFCSVFSEW